MTVSRCIPWDFGSSTAITWLAREVLARAVRWAAEQGVSQFIELGCGLPTESSTHQCARGVPEARIAYAYGDPSRLASRRWPAAGPATRLRCL
jgi:hypothetical protein